MRVLREPLNRYVIAKLTPAAEDAATRRVVLHATLPTQPFTV